MNYAGYSLVYETSEYVLFKSIVFYFISELDYKDDIRVKFSPKLNRLMYPESGRGYFVHNLCASY